MTKQTRLIYYHIAKIKIEKDDQLSICNSLLISVPSSIAANLNQIFKAFPELKTKKPSGTKDGVRWFPFTPSGQKKRINWLNKII